MPFIPQFVQTYKYGHQVVYHLSRRSPETIRLLSLLTRQMNAGNYVTMTRQQMMAEGQLSRSTVARALKLLIDLQVLEAVTAGRNTHYHVNGQCFWKGPTDRRSYAKLFCRPSLPQPGVFEQAIARFA